jgi:DNA-binding XRE family transcriptional regulator
MNIPTDHQTITTPAGERLVVLPESDYLAMVEAAELANDVAAIERFKAKLAKGEEELVPATVVNAILEGANPVRVWREYRGLSAKELAERAGVAAAYISQIETGLREGRLRTMSKIAEALGVGLDDLT